MANSTRPAEFLYDNMMIHATVVHASHLLRRDQAALPGQLVHLPAPRQPADHRVGAARPGALEPTNEPYAIAKIAGIKLCQSYRRQYGCNFISAMPTNLYGPNDNFDLESSHVLPALIRKFHEARGRRRADGRDLGLGHRVPRVPARRRPGRRLPLPDGRTTRTSMPHQRRHRRGPQHPGAGRDDPRRRLPDGRARLRRDQARRHAAQAARREPPPRPRAGRHSTPLREGIEETYRWYLEHETDTGARPRPADVCSDAHDPVDAQGVHRPLRGHPDATRSRAGRKLEPRPEIILFGRDAGHGRDLRRSSACVTCPTSRTNAHGTPLLSDMFITGQAAGDQPGRVLGERRHHLHADDHARRRRS